MPAIFSCEITIKISRVAGTKGEAGALSPLGLRSALAGFPYKFFGRVRSEVKSRPKNLIGDETHAESTPASPFLAQPFSILLQLSFSNR